MVWIDLIPSFVFTELLLYPDVIAGHWHGKANVYIQNLIEKRKLPLVCQVPML